MLAGELPFPRAAESGKRMRMTASSNQELPDSLCRLFVAIPLDERLRTSLHEAAIPLKELGAKVSWSRPEAMHLTLVFLGDTFAARIPPWSRALDTAVAGMPCFTLSFADLGYFGRPRSPRVLWAGIDSPPEVLFTLRERIADALRAENAAFDERPFHPHVTLGRVRSGRHAGALAETLATLRRNPPRLGTQRVGRVELIQSLRTPEGPSYQTRHSAWLTEEPESRLR